MWFSWRLRNDFTLYSTSEICHSDTVIFILQNNMEQDIPVRLIRGHKTKNSYTGKVYTYDGLYKVETQHP